jgi:23S rRNA pseudouridine2605 synthase
MTPKGPKRSSAGGDRSRSPRASAGGGRSSRQPRASAGGGRSQPPRPAADGDRSHPRRPGSSGPQPSGGGARAGGAGGKPGRGGSRRGSPDQGPVGRAGTRRGAPGGATASRARRAGAGEGRAVEGLLRLNKALSGAGLGSRRAVEQLVRAGRVSIGGEVVHDLGRRVDPVSDRVEVDGSRVVLDERRRYWLLNKPTGVVSTAADPAGRPTVVGMVPEQPRVFPVGRLDRDTEGLLLLTNDGPLAHRLTHARYGIEKRYLAEVDHLPADAPARLRKGVELEDGFARPTRVRVVAGSGRRRMVEVVMVEGRNREVRRLLDAVGAPVRRLVRTAVGPVRLTGLAPGEFRPLRPEEIRGLYKAAGL